MALTAALLVGGCSSGSAGPEPSGATGSGAVISQSADHGTAAVSWEGGGVTFALPGGWSVFDGARLAGDPVAMAAVGAVGTRVGLDADVLAATLGGYERVAFGPDDSMLIVTVVPQADLDATSEKSVRHYLTTVCSRQPTMCETLVDFTTRPTPAGDAVVYVTSTASGYLSASVLLPYVARSGADSATRQGRRVSIESSTDASLRACLDSVLGSLRQA